MVIAFHMLTEDADFFLTVPTRGSEGGEGGREGGREVGSEGGRE